MKRIHLAILTLSFFLFLSSLQLEAGRRRHRKHDSAWSSCQILKAAGGLALGAWAALEIHTYGPGFSFSWEIQSKLEWEESVEELFWLLETAREKQENNSLLLVPLLGFSSPDSVGKEKEKDPVSPPRELELSFLDPQWEIRTYSSKESSRPSSRCWKLDSTKTSIVACSTP